MWDTSQVSSRSVLGVNVKTGRRAFTLISPIIAALFTILVFPTTPALFTILVFLKP